MSRIILGIGGYAMSGKDSVADTLGSEFGYYRTFMSKPLLSALKIINPYVGTYLRFNELIESVGYTKAKKQHEVRRLLQVVGTELVRNTIDPDIWVKQVMREVSGTNKAVITGIRFRNEIDYINSQGGTTLWVSRPGYGPVNNHSSEVTLDMSDFDIAISNNGTLDDLKRQAEWVEAHLSGKFNNEH